ncbi:unnamed protein product [Kuraishia capsulata CBS 1993]|uniref:Uncharacterized protein n=1 Tax=Kuraishia capsulata CBS 1993 TaxID=1382522 RepID=W6MQ63_9ASCO|nr:uncharacterized protein KUCA_T00003375001 [Kuraishia capsulata CBS 1993]CDK27397.1 unnamed protein product [Kuraishia capsulata CBS 1993]
MKGIWILSQGLRYSARFGQSRLSSSAAPVIDKESVLKNCEYERMMSSRTGSHLIQITGHPPRMGERQTQEDFEKPDVLRIS